MILLGLTGGIGSGKSTVSSLLADRGAVIIDADAIVRELQQPGSPLLDTLAEEFGSTIIGPDGALDRAALAAVAFADKDTLARLNAIVHPAVGAEMSRRIDAERAGDRIVVLDIPLLAENPREGLCGIVVVDVPVDVAVARLIAHRGFTEDDARARIASQIDREKRLAIADVVVDNSGDLAALEEQVDRVWKWASALPPAGPDAGRPTPRGDDSDSAG